MAVEGKALGVKAELAASSSTVVYKMKDKHTRDMMFCLFRLFWRICTIKVARQHSVLSVLSQILIWLFFCFSTLLHLT